MPVFKLIELLSFSSGGPTIYAIIETGGKQYKVTPGQKVAVDRMDVPEGEKVELSRVLLLSDGEKVTLGTPTVAGAAVSATVAEQFKGKKLIVYNYKPKVRYDKKRGHRQQYTRLFIDSITGPGFEAKAPVKEPIKEEVK
jgi:large subunit ribosomal protein L21